MDNPFPEIDAVADSVDQVAVVGVIGVVAAIIFSLPVGFARSIDDGS